MPQSWKSGAGLAWIAALAACGGDLGAALAPVAAPPGGDLLLDRNGALASSDLRGTVGFVDRYDVEVRAGDRVRVMLSSPAFDPVLEVTPPHAPPLTNDDVAGDRTRSELELVATSAGQLKVQVTSFQPGAQGEYHLRVARVPAPPDAVAAAPAVSRRHHRLGTSLGVGAPIAIGARTSAVLDASDARLESGESADVYTLELAAPTDLTIQMRSSAIDSYLIVRRPDGELVENDDSGGALDSSVSIPAAAGGRYTIIASSFRAGASGAYEIKVLSSREALGGARMAAGPEQVLAGELAAGDAQLVSGEYSDEHLFRWSAGTPVHLEARSSAFDTYLILRTPSGQQRDNDDQAPGLLHAALDFVAQEEGQYRVIVTSYRPGETGAYQLAVRAASQAPAEGQHSEDDLVAGTSPLEGIDPRTYQPGRPGRPGRPARPGRPSRPSRPARPTRPTRPAAESGDRTITGALAAGDQTLRSGEFADTHRISFTPGAPVSIRMDSGQFDTYLIVRSPSGRQQDNDDLRPGILHSGIDIPAAEAGEYQILATSYRPGEAGEYTIRITSGRVDGAAAIDPPVPPAPAGEPMPGRPDTPPAAPGTGSRVWVLSVGISDYPGGANDLPECANDAVKIAEALRGQGLTAPEREFLLTDSQATIANIRAAMQRIASQVREEDTFVFFYSGHGGQAAGVRASDTRELDGIDEYIFVYDGQLIDDELGRLFDQVHARTSLAAIDACFAGGFAKDLITRPGVVGMFSSEEDVTSGVAMQFQAGGYLSHFLRLGIQGAADADPRDRVMTVGELTHYVWQQYGRQASDVRMGDSYQHLVVDRGAVHATQQLWRSGA